jgi:DNA-binding transcriptional regulator YiaG
MTPDEFKAAREKLGLSITDMARALRLSPDGRAVRRYERGEREISGPIERLIELFLKSPDLL